jgi:hypothetical protein
MTPATFILLCLITGLACGAISAAVVPGGQRGLAFLIGFLLGPLGVLIAVILGNRSPDRHTSGTPAALMARLPDLTPRPVQSSFTDLPDHLTIRRGPDILGTWPLADVLDFLTEGRLVPTDHYLHDPTRDRWHPLTRLQ